MTLTDKNLKTIRDSFENLDFSQPGVHKCYREMSREWQQFLFADNKVSWREYYFWGIGYTLKDAANKFKTIPPVKSVVPEESKGEK